MDLVQLISSVSWQSRSAVQCSASSADICRDVCKDAEYGVGSDGAFGWCLGSNSLNHYYSELFSNKLTSPVEGYLSKVFLNFAVQQLATRSYVDSQNHRYLQVGSFYDDDFAAALIGGMPHTQAFFLSGGGAGAGVENALEKTRRELAGDDMASAIVLPDMNDGWLHSQPDASFGSISLLMSGGVEVLERYVDEVLRLLNPRGRLLILQQVMQGETLDADLGSGWMLEASRAFSAADPGGSKLRVRTAGKAQEVLPIEVQEWAPRELVCGVGANVQVDGSSAMWLRTNKYDPETARIFISFGEERVERKAVVTPGLLSSQIPAEIVQMRGRYSVYIRQYYGSTMFREDFVGFLEVR